MSRDRARISILSELLSFPTVNQKDWHSFSFSNTDICEGDLVSLYSAPASKWYVSWVREVDENNGWPRYLLESIDDGSLCWWVNVGINVYSRERVRERPAWQWDDKQFAFNDRWNKVAKRNDAYIVLPMPPVFRDDGSVTLDVRIRFGMVDFSCPETFSNWKKLTMKQMDAYYKKCENEYNNRKPSEYKE
jgi:hypothetical protein